MDGLCRHLTLHRATAAARHGEFYRLTSDAPGLRAWEGWQMHDPATGSGVVALWRSEAPDDSILVSLRGLVPTGAYSVRDPNLTWCGLVSDPPHRP